MKIGILFEGKLDIPSVEIIVRRIIGLQEGFHFFYYEAKGTIIQKMKPALTYFKSEKVDFSIFITDIDDFPERRKLIKKFIGENSEIKIISAYCNPHFEEWFISEKEAVCHVLEVDFEAPVKTLIPKNNPKMLIDRLISEKMKRNKETLFQDEVYKEISNNLNLDVLAKRNSDFNDFREELTNYLKNINI